MVFPLNIPNATKICINCVETNKVVSCQYLSIVIHEEFKWNEHIESVCNKLCKYTSNSTNLEISYLVLQLRYVVHGRGCNPHRSLWRHWWRHNSETIRYREKRRPRRAMKSSELSNGENCIALRQLLQNRKWHQWWRNNLGSRWKLQKMARENFTIGAFYNITKNQDNPIKTVGRDSFLSPKTPKNTSF